jgi:hypothetical protein
MKKLSLISSISIVVVLASLISGCAGTIKNMREVPADRAEFTPEKGNAVIVFMRPSGMGFAIQSSVFEIKDNNPSTLAGIVAAKTKVAYRVEPGKHLFMVVGESADFMTADIQPNKTYYAYVTPRMGVWKARFSLEPKHKADLNTSDFSSALADCKWVEKSPDSDKWMLDNLDSIKSKRADYYPDWLQQPENERPHLLPEDGK